MGHIVLLYIMSWSILIAIGMMFLRYIRSLKQHINVNHIVMLFMALILINLTAGYVKPEMFSTLFFALLVVIYFYAKSTKKSYFFFYPVIFLIWVNTHGGFILGLTFISIALAGEVLNTLFIGSEVLEKKVIVQFTTCVFLSYLATLINPYGIYYHIDTLSYLLSKEYMGTASALYAYFSLWDFLLPENLMFRYINSAWTMVILLCIYLVNVANLYKKQKSFDVTLLVLNLFFFILGMKIARASMMFPLIAIFSIIYIANKSDSESIGYSIRPVSVLLILVLSVYIFIFALKYYDNRSWLGYNMKGLLPIKEVEFIKKNKLQGPFFNDYLIGSYMIWSMYPDYKVWIDTRYGPYVKQVWPDWINLKNNLTPEGFKKYYSKYGYKAALIHMRERYIIAWFLSSPDWRLVYFDKVAVVLMHKSLIKTLTPEALSTDADPSRFRNVSNPASLLNLFNFYLMLGSNPNIGTKYAKEMISIYDENVSRYYVYKKQQLESMRDGVEKVEDSLR
jgi:hypothetical protein